MAKKDDEHPEFDDTPFFDEELADLSESSSDAIEFSGIDLGGSDSESPGLSNASGLFDFSEDESTGGSSFKLAGIGDGDAAEEEEAASEEILDLEVSGDVPDFEDSSVSNFEDSSLGAMNFDESATDEQAEFDPDTVDAEPELEAVLVKGKKAKKEKKPKKVKEKKIKEKKVKEKKPRSPSEKPGLLVQASQTSVFTVMLVLSAASLFIAILVLLLEWSNYGFSIGAG